jgi:hypothetical protein
MRSIMAAAMTIAEDFVPANWNWQMFVGADPKIGW